MTDNSKEQNREELDEVFDIDLLLRDEKSNEKPDEDLCETAYTNEIPETEPETENLADCEQKSISELIDDLERLDFDSSTKRTDLPDDHGQDNACTEEDEPDDANADTALTDNAFDVIEKKAPTKAPFISTVFEWIELFVCSLVAVMIIMCFFVRHSPVIGSSMEPTLEEGDILIISELFYTPKVGDIVIVQAPYNPEEPLVKRVIAKGGQSIEINFISWEIKVDGKIIEEPYINYDERDLYGISMRSNDLPTDENGCWSAVVPEGCLFVLGDNRTISKDSRNKDVGFVDEHYVIGHVKFRLFPFDKIGTFSAKDSVKD